MRKEKRMAGFKPARWTAAVMALLLTLPAWGASRFHLEKDAEGRFRPFQIVAVPLVEFVREYARISPVPIAVGGDWAEELKGNVTLILRRPQKPEDLAEIFHRVLADNGYAAVDAPSGNGWIIVRSRDARDLALPVYEMTQVPDSSRLVTAYHDLKYADPEKVARVMRNFMPANSRILPTAGSQVFVTDTATNIRKLNQAIAQMDTEEAGRRQREDVATSVGTPPRACGEHRIEKLVVENLEIQENKTPERGKK